MFKTQNQTVKPVLDYQPVSDQPPVRFCLANVSFSLSAIAFLLIMALFSFAQTIGVASASGVPPGFYNRALGDTGLLAAFALAIAIGGTFQRRTRARAVLAAAAALFVTLIPPALMAA